MVSETSDDIPQPPSVQTELIRLSLPAIAGQAIEPLAQLMETAYIGRLGMSNVCALFKHHNTSYCNSYSILQNFGTTCGFNIF